TPSMFSRRRWRRGPCDIGELLIRVGTAAHRGTGAVIVSRSRERPPGYVPTQRTRPAGAIHVRITHAYHKVSQNQGGPSPPCRPGRVGRAAPALPRHGRGGAAGPDAVRARLTAASGAPYTRPCGQTCRNARPHRTLPS